MLKIVPVGGAEIILRHVAPFNLGKAVLRAAAKAQRQIAAGVAPWRQPFQFILPERLQERAGRKRNQIGVVQVSQSVFGINKVIAGIDIAVMGSVRGRGGLCRRAGGVAGVAIEDVGLWWSCELQPRTEEDPDDREQYDADRFTAKA